MADDLVGIIVVGIVMLVPIIAILLKHQQSMAELYRDERVRNGVEPQLQQDNEALRKELSEVKQLLYEQSIAIDNLARSQSTATQISERLEDRAK